MRIKDKWEFVNTDIRMLNSISKAAPRRLVVATATQEFELLLGSADWAELGATFRWPISNVITESCEETVPGVSASGRTTRGGAVPENFEEREQVWTHRKALVREMEDLVPPADKEYTHALQMILTGVDNMLAVYPSEKTLMLNALAEFFLPTLPGEEEDHKATGGGSSSWNMA